MENPTMKTTKPFVLLTLFAFVVLVAARRAEAAPCSTAAAAGKWAYTYTGTIFTPSGPLSDASVGHFSADQQAISLAARHAALRAAPGLNKSPTRTALNQTVRQQRQ